jgi:hypothetical protein
VELSKVCKAILGEYLANFGDITISEEDGARLYLGTAASKVSDLPDEHLIQLVLCATYALHQDENRELSKLRVEKEVQVGIDRMTNRMSKRH